MTQLRQVARMLVVLSTVGALTVLGSGAWAHPHSVETGSGRKQVIANGQNHYMFPGGLSCEGGTPAGPDRVGSAWYGLETAHHGPDSGTSGRGDDCYQLDGTSPGDDIHNDTIK